jgi:hypothetical protein
MDLKTAVGRVGLSGLALFRCGSWQNEALNSRDCLDPKGEFHGCSIMSLEPQKKSLLSERQLFQLPDIG